MRTLYYHAGAGAAAAVRGLCQPRRSCFRAQSSPLVRRACLDSVVVAWGAPWSSVGAIGAARQAVVTRWSRAGAALAPRPGVACRSGVAERSCLASVAGLAVTTRVFGVAPRCGTGRSSRIACGDVGSASERSGRDELDVSELIERVVEAV